MGIRYFEPAPQPAYVPPATAKAKPATKQPAPAGTDVTKAERTTTKAGTETTQYGTATMSEAAQRALDALLAQNGSAFQKQQQATKVQLLQDLQTRLAGLTPEKAEEAARGDVDELTRELMEGILPEVSGAFEGAGASASALEALLSQKAAVRTGEAQARAVGERQESYAGQASDIMRTLTEATSAPDEIIGSLVDLLGVAKGGVRTGEDVTTFTAEDVAAEDVSEAEGLTAAEQTQEDLASKLLQSELDTMKQTLADMEAAAERADVSASGELTRAEKIALYNSQASAPYGSPVSLGYGLAEQRQNRANRQKDAALASSLGL